MKSGLTHLLSQIFLLFRGVSEEADILSSESYSGERELAFSRWLFFA